VKIASKWIEPPAFIGKEFFLNKERVMPYAVQTFDRVDQPTLRADVRDEHVADLKSKVALLLAGGALI
jgi:hypothetical protein